MCSALSNTDTRLDKKGFVADVAQQLFPRVIGRGIVSGIGKFGFGQE